MELRLGAPEPTAPTRSAPACPYERATKKHHGISCSAERNETEDWNLKNLEESRGLHTNLGPVAVGSLPGQESGEFPVWQQNYALIPHGIRRGSPSSGSGGRRGGGASN
jgi:hypothetical protein